MEILINALIRATGWSILHSLWQGAILYTLLLLFFLLNPKLSAKTRHNLSFMALIGIFLWFVQTFCTEFSKWVAVGKSIQAFAGMPLNYTANIAEIPTSLLFDRAEKSIPAIVFIYSIGLILQIVYLLLGYYKVLQIRTKGLTDLTESLNDRFSDLSARLGINRTVRFVQSSLVSVPLVIGYFKPMVLLPLSVLTRFNPQQLEAIIIHELSHIRRNDYLLNILKISIETILFFNPFVWLSAKVIDTERENACDDLVLNITGSPLSYAMTLLELEKLKYDQGVFSLAITGKKYYLLNRIKRITNMKTSTLNLKIQLLAIVVAVSGVFSLAWIPVKKEKPEIKTEAPAPEKNSLQNTKYTFSVVYSNPVDTLKRKFKIIVEDDKGNKKEYTSVSQLPPDIRAEFLKQNRNVNGLRSTPLIVKSDGGLTFLEADTIMVKGFSGKFDSAFTIYNKAMNDANFNFRMNADSFKIMRVDKDGKIISADPKIIAWSKKLAGFTIDKDGNILDGYRNIIDKLAGGKPLIVIDSSMSSYLTKPLSANKLSGLAYGSILPKMTTEQLEKFRNQFNSPEWKKRVEDLNNQLNSPDYKSRKDDIQKSIDQLRNLLQSPEIRLQLNQYTPDQLHDVNKQFSELIGTKNSFAFVMSSNNQLAEVLNVNNDIAKTSKYFTGAQTLNTGSPTLNAAIITASKARTYGIPSDVNRISPANKDIAVFYSYPNTATTAGSGNTRGTTVTLKSDRSASNNLTTAKSISGSNSFTTGSARNAGVGSKTFPEEGQTMTIKSYSPNDPARREAIQKILESPEGKEKIKKILHSTSQGYVTTPDGKLELDYNMTFIFPEGAVSQRDIIDYFPKTTLKNDFDFTPETQQQRVKRVLEDPANKAKLDEIHNKDSKPAGRGTYIFPDGSMVQQSDIDNYYKKQNTPKPAEKPQIAKPVEPVQKLNNVRPTNQDNIYVDATTDLVKFNLIKNGTPSKSNNGIFIVGDKTYSAEELKNKIAEEGQFKIFVARPTLTVFTENDPNAIKKWGDIAKNGVTIVKSYYSKETSRL